MADCNTNWALTMEAEKTVGLRFLVTPRVKRMLEDIAARERRSLTNTLVTLVDDYCRQHGISEENVSDPKKSGTKGNKTA